MSADVETLRYVGVREAALLRAAAEGCAGRRRLQLGLSHTRAVAALAGAPGTLDVVDPTLKDEDWRAEVEARLARNGVGSATLHGLSVQEAWDTLDGEPWTLVYFEDGAGLDVVQEARKRVGEDAMMLLPGMCDPAAAEALNHLRSQGWRTMLYSTPGVLGVAWRGEASAPEDRGHADWTPPTHLRSFAVSGEEPEIRAERMATVLSGEPRGVMNDGQAERLRQARAEILAVEEQLHALRDELKDAHTATGDRESALGEAREALGNQEAKRILLDAEAEQLRVSLREAARSESEARRRETETRDAWAADTERLNLDLRSAHEEAEALRRDIEGAAAEKKALDEQLWELRSRQQQQSAQQQDTERELNELRVVNSGQAETLRQSSAEILAVEEQLRALRDELKNAHATADDRESALREAREALGSQEAKRALLDAEAEQLRISLREAARSEAEAHRREIETRDAWTADTERLNVDLRSVREEAEALRRDIEGAESERKVLDGQLWELRSRAQQQSAQQQDAQRELNELRDLAAERATVHEALVLALETASANGLETRSLLDASEAAVLALMSQRDDLERRLTHAEDARRETLDLLGVLQTERDTLIFAVARAGEVIDRLEEDGRENADRNRRHVRGLSRAWAQAETEREELRTAAELGALRTERLRTEFNAVSVQLAHARMDARRRRYGLLSEPTPRVPPELDAGEPVETGKVGAPV